MKLSEYNYELPEKCIAVHPPKVRGTSRLLKLDRRNGTVSDHIYKDIVSLLEPGDLLVINNTKVIPARLKANTLEGQNRELLLLEQHGKTSSHLTSLVMFRGKIKPGQKLTINQDTVEAVEVYENGTALIKSNHDLWDIAEKQGQIPLPPYMNREEEPEDRIRYQTEFAKNKGSVAAPTASLNMTNDLLAKLKDKGVNITEITLHVGLGTFMPIRTDDITKHKMHQEYFEITESTIEAIRETKSNGGRVIALGTTVTRTLEYAAMQILDKKQTGHISGEADIFIYPGYVFEIVDGMLTNFHAPKSTVLMMAAAFAGWDNLINAYHHAIAENYKFLSYGDSMLII